MELRELVKKLTKKGMDEDVAYGEAERILSGNIFSAMVSKKQRKKTRAK